MIIWLFDYITYPREGGFNLKKVNIHRRFLLLIVLGLSVNLVCSQTGTISNISVQPRTDGSGMVDVHFNLSGSADSYNILIEVSFDAGDTYTPIPTIYLSGDLQGISPGNRHVVWDGYGSFPNEFSTQTRIKIVATAADNGGGNGDDTEVVDVINPATGQIWMDRNLGASRAAISITDTEAYGDLYQWGRAADGHQIRTSGTTFALSSSDTPGHGDFILTSSSPLDWRSPQNDNLWHGVNGTNNPCPAGYRLPTEAEFNAERLSWSSNNVAGAFASPLKLPVTGRREPQSNGMIDLENKGFYWSSTVDVANSRSLLFRSGDAVMVSNHRALGSSVRCLKDSEPNTHTLNLNISPTGTGQVSGAGEYGEGMTVAITAIPNVNYQFVNWTGDTDHIADANASSTTLTMPAQNITLTANFAAENGSGNIQPGEGVTDIDGNFYPSVIIGNQEWMAENLRVTKYNNGDAIPTGLENSEWQTTANGAYAIYNNDNAMLEAYGKLYNWYAVVDARGLCPNGWHVPSDAEWTNLVDYMVAQGYPNEWNYPNGAANALKSCRQVSTPLGGDCDTAEHPRWNSHSTHYGTDEFGFSALPGGNRDRYGVFGSVGHYVNLWSSSESNSIYAWRWALGSNNGKLGRYSNNKEDGGSIRCLRD